MTSLPVMAWMAEARDPYKALEAEADSELIERLVHESARAVVYSAALS